MTVALLGTFDVPNFGDLLFPLLARRRLDGTGLALQAWSPVGGRPFEDADDPRPVRELTAPDAVGGGVILGGGNIVHAWSASRVYAGFDPPHVAAYPELWIGAALAALRAGVPLVWNAPGVPAAPAPAAARLLKAVCEASDYVSVRDEGSRTALASTGFQGHVDVVPDPAFDVTGLWTADELDTALASTLQAAGHDRPDRFVVFHASPQRTPESPADLSRAFDALADAWNARPLLLAIGPCHGDGELLQRAAAGMSSEPIVLAGPRRLVDIAACLARGVAYVGASMHGGITSAAFCRPTRFVVPPGDHKFPGAATHLEGAAGVCSSWADAGPGPDPEAEPAALRLALDSIGPRLDAHWSRIRGALLASDKPRLPDTHAEATLGASAEPLPGGGDSLFAPILLEMLQTAVARRHASEQSLAAAHDRIAWLEDAWARERAARNAAGRTGA